MADDNVAGEQIKAFIERVENLNEEIAVLTADRKEVFAEARGNGFDVKILRKIIAIRQMDRSEFLEQESLLDLYMSAIGLGVTDDEVED